MDAQRVRVLMAVIGALLRREDGIGVVTALMVSFIIFTLGATWYAVSVHELDEVVFDRHRTQAVHAADAGVREATYLLANDQVVRDNAKGASVWTQSGSPCGLTDLQTTVDGSTEIVGQYWLRISDATPSDTTDYRYFIESWGWAPRFDARQADSKKVELEAVLLPKDGFDYALFAASLGLTAGNKKEIYGDVYSGKDVLFSNSTRIWDNDAGYPGDGNLEVYGNLTIPSGSNVHIDGTTTVNGYIDDQHPGDEFVGDVTQVRDLAPADSLPSGHEAFFKKGKFGGTVRLGGTYAPASQFDPISGPGPVPIVQGAVGLAEVPLRSLPTFTWDPADYTPAGQTYATWAAFDSYYAANKTSLSGAHYVTNPALNVEWNIKNAKFADDFVLVVDGKLRVKGNADLTATAPLPVTVALIGNSSTSKITLAQNFQSSDNLRYLIYSKGQFEASQQTTVYGTIYAEEDVSSNQLTIKFRPPDENIVAGFDFAGITFGVEPGVWREVPFQGLPCTLP